VTELAQGLRKMIETYPGVGYLALALVAAELAVE
jgi:hypothetical protein